MPRLISASARRSSPRPGRAASGASAAACSRRASSITAAGVAALPGQQQPDHPEQHLHPAAAPRRHRHRTLRRERQVPPGLLQRPPGQLIGRGQRGQLRIRRARLGGEPGQQRVHGRCLPAQVQAGPGVGEQPGGQPQSRAAWAWRTASTANPCPANHPAAAACSRSPHRGGAPQLQLQQPGEQPVVAEPRPRRIQRHHERVRGLQVLQDPIPPEPPVSASASSPLTRSRTEVRNSSRRTCSPAAPAPQPAGTPPPSARSRRTRPRTAPGPGARPATAPPAADRRPPLGPLIQHLQRRPGQLHPAAASSSRASARLNRRSAARSSASSPSSRSRCSPSRRSCRVASTNRSRSGARITSSSSWRRAHPSPARARRRAPARSGPPAAPGPSAAAR